MSVELNAYPVPLLAKDVPLLAIVLIVTMKFLENSTMLQLIIVENVNIPVKPVVLSLPV